MQREPRTKDKLLNLLTKPRTYTELKETLSISDPAIQKHLRDLLSQDLVKKNNEGMYELTEKGKDSLRFGKAAETSGQFEAALDKVAKSKLNPSVRNDLIAYGLCLGVKKMSAEQKGKLQRINREAEIKVQSLQNSLEKYKPEYTGPFERMADGLRRDSFASASYLLSMSTILKETKEKQFLEIAKLARSLYFELLKKQLKGLLGL